MLAALDENARSAEVTLKCLNDDSDFVRSKSLATGTHKANTFYTTEISVLAIDLATNSIDGSADVAAIQELVISDDASDFTLASFTADVFLPPNGTQFHILKGQRFLLSLVNQGLRLKERMPRILRHVLSNVPVRIHFAENKEEATEAIFGKP